MTLAQHRTALRRLARTRQTAERARLRMPDAARAAREAGLSYGEIATCLGLASRMHAHRLVNGRTDQ